MIRRITLTNFMAHRNTVIEPADGLTVLVGPNNCGKSAVVEALQVLAGNSGKDFMVRHGESECRVRVETSEGHRIEWRRIDGAVSYEVNGAAVHRLHGNVPDGLHGLLKLPSVNGPEGKDAFAVHFGTQKEPIFLLDRTGRHTATFFAASSDASRLLEMQVAHRRKVNERRAEERGLAARERQLARGTESLESVGGLLDELTRVEAQHAAIAAEMAALTTMERMISTLRRQTRALRAETDRVNVLRELPQPPVLAETGALERLLTRIEDTSRVMTDAAAQAAALHELPSPPAVHDLAPLRRIIDALEAAARAHAIAEKKAAVLTTLPPAPEWLDVATLSAHAAALQTAHAARAHEVAELDRLNAQLAQTAAAMQDWAAENPVCPTCGAPIQPFELTSEEHVHAS